MEVILHMTEIVEATGAPVDLRRLPRGSQQGPPQVRGLVKWVASIVIGSRSITAYSNSAEGALTALRNELSI